MTETLEIKEVKLHKILVAIDNDDLTSSANAMNFACTLAKDNKTTLGIATVNEITDLNVFDSLSPNKIVELRKELVEKLNTWAEQAKDFGVKDVETIIGEGSPGEVIVNEIVDAFKPDLLVIGSDAAANHHAHLFGTHADYIAQHASCSVSIIK